MTINNSKKTTQYCVLILCGLLAAFPIYFALVSSLKESMEVFLSPFSLPTVLRWDNYSRAVLLGNIGICFRNSLFLTLVTIILTALTGTMASYILARFSFKARSFIYIFFVAGLMIPIQSIIIPLSFTFGKLKIYDNYPVLILLFTSFNLSFTIFITTSFLKTLPRELEEAATIDGCSRAGIFCRIIAPLSAPGVVTASVFNFLSVWNNLLFPLVFVRKKSYQVIALGLQSFFAERVSDYGAVMAAIIISIIPPIFAYLLLQEKVEQGMMAGAVKG